MSLHSLAAKGLRLRPLAIPQLFSRGTSFQRKFSSVAAGQRRLVLKKLAESIRPPNGAAAALGRVRTMGGGKPFQINKVHEFWGEFYGFIMWMWIFYRFKEDGAVLMGWCHPWDNH
mmetsp:Transcript_39769/g.77698  ORF Transcript_39769/g.77698 Transcript_39769/m.77698 type:complete len:116 (-) Transcript_39769:236-583(-)